jgi:hypothetical protein
MQLLREAYNYLDRQGWDLVHAEEPNPFDGYVATIRHAALARVRDRRLYHLYLRSQAWAARRREVIAEAGGACERCQRSFLVCLDVHHLHYRNLGNEAAEDLQALCRDCHEQADDERRWRRCACLVGAEAP